MPIPVRFLLRPRKKNYRPLARHFSSRVNFFLTQGRRKESRARGADRSKRAPTTLGQQIYPRNGGHPRHCLGNIMGYASQSYK